MSDYLLCDCCGSYLGSKRAVPFEDIHGVEYVKRAIEVSLVQNHVVHIYCTETSKSVMTELLYYFPDSPIGLFPTCECGHFGSPTKVCYCEKSFKVRDDYDLFLFVPEHDTMFTPTERKQEPLSQVLNRVEKAKEFIYRVSWEMEPTASRLFKMSCKQYSFSKSRQTPLLGLSRSVAALSGSKIIRPVHFAEALQYTVLNGRI